jgi:hypothetical protein
MMKFSGIFIARFSVWVKWLFLFCSALVTGEACAQDETFLNRLQKSLLFWNSHQEFNQVSVTFNQAKYAAGDTAYFASYYLSAKDRKPVAGTKILYVTLQSRGNLIFFKKYLLKNGYGAGQLVVPQNISPGVYQIGVYTDDILAMDSSRIKLYNFVVAGERTFVTPPANESVLVSVEGGHFVSGLENRIVVRTNKPAAGRIVGRDGSLLKEFTTNQSGIAAFTLKPLRGESYSLVVNDVSHELPAVEPDGVALETALVNADKSFSITLRSSPESSWRGKKVYLVILSSTGLHYAEPVLIKQNSQSISIPTDDLSPGMIQVALMSSDWNLLGERMLFIRPPKKVEFAVSAIQEKFQTRSPVTLDISLNARPVKSFPATFSIRVTPDTLMDEDQAYFESDLTEDILFSEVQSNRYMFKDFMKLSPEDQHALMIACPAGYLNWRRILASPGETLRKSTNSFFRGKVVHAKTGEAIKDSTFVTFYLNRNDFVYGLHTRPDGTFQFPLFKNFGDEEIFYALESAGKPLADAKIIMDDQVALNGADIDIQKSGKPDPYFQYARIKASIIRSYDYYFAKEKPDQSDEGNDLEGDFEVDLTKLEPLKSMGAVLSNVVTMVRYTKTKSEERIRVFLRQSAMYAKENPVYIIDGIMTDNMMYFLSLDPAKVSKIKVLRNAESLSRYGAVGKNGIIIVETFIQDHAAQIPRTDRSLFVTGITEPIAFEQPDPERKSARVPDLRSTLYWSPSTTLESKGSKVIFYTGDMTGFFNVKVQGITNDGVLFEGETRIQVSYNP